MKFFQKHLKNSSIIFGEVQDYFFVIKFQSRGLAYDHGLLWVKNAQQYNISPNEEVKKIINKYLTTNQIILKNELQTTQIHKHKRTCRKKGQLIC